MVLALAAAAMQLVGTHFAASRQPLARPLDWFGVVLLLAGPALLLLHRRAPEAMLGGVLAVTAGYLALGYPWGPVPLSMGLAIILTTAARRRAYAWSVAGALVAALFIWAAVHGGGADFVRAAAVSGWLVILVFFGEGLRLRRERAAERRAKAQEAKKRAEDEYRLALARDIHDVVAHSLSMINVRASVALHLAERDPAQLKPALEAIKSGSKDALEQVRELLGVLRRDAPLQPGLTLDGLSRLLEDARGAGLAAELTFDGGPGLVRDRLGPAGEAVVYKVVQEAVVNVVRHAGASRVAVRLELQAVPGEPRPAVPGPGQAAGAGQQLRVSIRDDGRGVRGAPEGNGRRGMRERLAAVGGTVDITDGHPGTLVTVVVPLHGTGGAEEAEPPSDVAR